jgi:hypothetical protein
MVSAALPSPSALGSGNSFEWRTLVRDLEQANKQWATAMSHLSEAECRYFALPTRRRGGPAPDWYRAAQQAEAAAGDVVERLTLQIAGTRAVSREGLVLKVRLLAAAYGEDPDRVGRGASDPDDLVACLIRALIIDLS